MDLATGVIAGTAVVQAIATSAALYIGVAMPRWQQHRIERAAETERRLKAKCLATAIRFDLHDIRVSLGQANLTAKARASAPMPGAWVHEFLAAQIQIPSLLTASVDQVYLLGDPAGPTLLRLAAALSAYNQSVEREANRGITDPATGAAEHWRILAGFVRDVEPTVEQALGEVSSIADSKVS